MEFEGRVKELESKFKQHEELSEGVKGGGIQQPSERFQVKGGGT